MLGVDKTMMMDNDDTAPNSAIVELVGRALEYERYKRIPDAIPSDMLRIINSIPSAKVARSIELSQHQEFTISITSRLNQAMPHHQAPMEKLLMWYPVGDFSFLYSTVFVRNAYFGYGDPLSQGKHVCFWTRQSAEDLPLLKYGLGSYRLREHVAGYLPPVPSILDLYSTIYWMCVARRRASPIGGGGSLTTFDVYEFVDRLMPLNINFVTSSTPSTWSDWKISVVQEIMLSVGMSWKAYLRQKFSNEFGKFSLVKDGFREFEEQVKEDYRKLIVDPIEALGDDDTTAYSIQKIREAIRDGREREQRALENHKPVRIRPTQTYTEALKHGVIL